MCSFVIHQIKGKNYIYIYIYIMFLAAVMESQHGQYAAKTLLSYD